MAAPAGRIVFDHASVDFPIFDVSARSLRRQLLLPGLVSRGTPSVGGNMRRNRGLITVKALDDVSFALQDGDRVAVLGHNGAGKTTLLRVATGIYEPTAGDVMVQGRVMPLFNILEGMVPDGPGTEMVKVRGTLLGMTAAEIEEKTPEIAEFCDLGEYIHMPVRTYSAGMQVRLAFAITTAAASDILIMDEVIGAGDAAFFERAQVRLRAFVDRASVLMVATHSPDVARQWCNKAILLEHGRLLEIGPVDSVIRSYERLVRITSAAGAPAAP
jgi:ABC-type polysaccharide/polyol phosphate transport system ATPase subunit